MTQKIFILDVSGFLFRAYYALPPMASTKGVATQALFGFIRQCLKLIKDFDPKHLVAVFDGPNNKQSRLDLYKDYKSKRVQAPEDLPHQIELAKTFCDLYGIPKIEIPGHEADDVIGAVAVWAAKNGFESIICSADKDMCQLVSDHIKVMHVHKENLLIDEEKVKELFGVFPKQIVDYLALIGDASDNIPGVSGIGPKTATLLLQEYGTLENLLDNALKLKGKKQEVLLQEKDTALLSKRLATLNIDLEIPLDSEFYSLKSYKGLDLIEFYKEMNFNAFLKDVSIKVEVPRGNHKASSYVIVDDEESLNTLLENLLKQKEVCFDTETTSLDVMEAELVGIGFCYEKFKAYYVPFNGLLGVEKVLTFLKKLFNSPKVAFYGHNVKYDIHILNNYMIEVKNLSFDTMLASYLLYAQSRNHSLESLSLHYFGYTKTPITELLGTTKKGVRMSEVPIEQVANYCGLDTDLTLQLKEQLQAEIKERKLEDLFYKLELPLLIILQKMERKGIFVDAKILSSLSFELLTDIKKLEDDIYLLAGQSFNINSPKQLGHILQEKMGIHTGKKTSTGLISTSAEVLEELSHTHEIAKKLLDYRTLEKLRSTYVDQLPLMINIKTRRVHCTFNQSVAATGRLSCQNPNLQNIPIRSPLGRKIREAFRPEIDSYSFLSGDYSQIELRLLAHLSEDPYLVKAFENDEDIHAFTASLIFDIPLNEVSSEQRSQAKTVNFGIIYGQQPYGLARELGISMANAKKFIDAYYKRFTRVFEFLEECKKQARLTGKAVTMVGRERDILEINSKNPVLRNQAERLAINTPLQGSAADLIKLAMLKVEDRLTKEKLLSTMILQIHDELLFEAPDFELIILENLVKDSMENVFKLKVPLKVDIAIGKNWKEC
jgi:DNA polymerase-1